MSLEAKLLTSPRYRNKTLEADLRIVAGAARARAFAKYVELAERKRVEEQFARRSRRTPASLLRLV